MSSLSQTSLQTTSLLTQTETPKKSSCTNLQCQKTFDIIFSGTFAALILTGTAFTLLASPPLLVSLAIIAFACFALTMIILNLQLTMQLTDYEDPETLENIVQDLKTLPFSEIMKKYSVDELYLYDVIGKKTHQAMKSIDQSVQEKLERMEYKNNYPRIRYVQIMKDPKMKNLVSRINQSFDEYRKKASHQLTLIK